MAAERLQFVALVDGLDAFGDDGEIESPAKLAKHLAQPGIDLVDIAIGDIGAVDLEFAERQLLQPGERRIAGAEIVERERAMARLQLPGHLVGELEIVDDLVFGDFEHEARPILCLRPAFAHHGRDRQLDQRRDRHVDVELHRHAVGGAILPIPQRGDDDALGERQHVALARARQEHAGAEHAAPRMPPTHQRLGADEPHGLELDLRLIPKLEPAALEHVGKRHLAVIAGARRQRGRKQLAQDLVHAVLGRRIAGLWSAS